MADTFTILADVSTIDLHGRHYLFTLHVSHLNYSMRVHEVVTLAENEIANRGIPYSRQDYNTDVIIQYSDSIQVIELESSIHAQAINAILYINFIRITNEDGGYDDDGNNIDDEGENHAMCAA